MRPFKSILLSLCRLLADSLVVDKREGGRLVFQQLLRPSFSSRRGQRQKMQAVERIIVPNRVLRIRPDPKQVSFTTLFVNP